MPGEERAAATRGCMRGPLAAFESASVLVLMGNIRMIR